MNLFARLFFAAFLFSPALFASDHIDGPVTTAHRVADLTDLYAFPTPYKPGFLSIILNTYPLVSATGHFTDKASFNVILRRAKVMDSGNALFQTSDEVTIYCIFKTPNAIKDHVAMCSSTNGLKAVSRYDDASPSATQGDFRLYAGMRSDPFFFNAEWAAKAGNEGILLAPANENTMEDINMLSLVMELDMSKFYNDEASSLFAVAAEVTTQDSQASSVRRLDRLGRPEVTNVSLVAHNEMDLRDEYNLDQPFNVDPKRQKYYEDRLAKNINFYDRLDRKQDWNDLGRLQFAQTLSNDYLVVDINKPCQAPAFLEIEMSALAGKPHTTCGGRKPTDDVMDILFTLYINGGKGPLIRDGVDYPAKEVSDNFPYLAPPELGFLARTKAFIARQLLGIAD